MLESTRAQARTESATDRRTDNVVDLNARRPAFINPTATAWARQQPIKDISLRHLLTIIAGFANEAFECWPSQALLAYEAQKDERTVRRQMKKLDQMRFIKVEHRRNADGERETSLIKLLIEPHHRTSMCPVVHRTNSAFTTGHFPPSPPDIKVSGNKEQQEQQEEHIRAPLDQAETLTLRSQNSSASAASRSRASSPPPTSGENRNGAAPEFNLTAPAPKIDVAKKFYEFMLAYPKRKGSNPRKTASDKFSAAVKRGVDPDLIIAGAKRYGIEERRNIGTEFIAQAVTWLHQQRWADYAPAPSAIPIDAEEARRLEALDQIRGHLG
jgi:hypothetical protein